MSKIGFVGIGAMGLNMSRNLLKAGFDLLVYNRTPEKCAPLVEAGAQTASSFAELLSQTDTLIMMLTGPRAIEDCVGPILEGSPSVFSGKLLVNMGTNAPAFTADLNQRLIEAGAVFVDSPVIGSSKPAELGTLLIMPSGPEDAVKKLTPLFMAMGERIVNCGQPPQASMMKLTVNLVQIAMMEGLAEGVHFARKGGLDLATLFEILLKGAVGNSLYELKARKYLEDDFTPQSTLSGVRDVLQQIAETAYDMEADIPNTLANLNLSNRAMKDGLGGEDFCALVKILDR